MKISTFDLNLFVVLNAIYTEGSLTKAAEVVGITLLQIHFRAEIDSKDLEILSCL